MLSSKWPNTATDPQLLIERVPCQRESVEAIDFPVASRVSSTRRDRPGIFLLQILNADPAIDHGLLHLIEDQERLVCREKVSSGMNTSCNRSGSYWLLHPWVIYGNVPKSYNIPARRRQRKAKALFFSLNVRFRNAVGLFMMLSQYKEKSFYIRFH